MMLSEPCQSRYIFWIYFLVCWVCFSEGPLPRLGKMPVAAVNMCDMPASKPRKEVKTYLPSKATKKVRVSSVPDSVPEAGRMRCSKNPALVHVHTSVIKAKTGQPASTTTWLHTQWLGESISEEKGMNTGAGKWEDIFTKLFLLYFWMSYNFSSLESPLNSLCFFLNHKYQLYFSSSPTASLFLFISGKGEITFNSRQVGKSQKQKTDLNAVW